MLTSVILQERLKDARQITQGNAQERVAARIALNAAEREPGKFRRLVAAERRYHGAKAEYEQALAVELGLDRALRDRLEEEVDG